MKPVRVRMPLAYDFARKRQALIASCAHLSVLANRVVARKQHALDYRLRAIVSGSTSRPREQISQRKRQRQHPLADRLPRQDVVHEQGRRLGHPPGAAARAKPAALAAEREVVAHSLESFGSGPNRPLKAKRGAPRQRARAPPWRGRDRSAADPSTEGYGSRSPRCGGLLNKLL